MSKLSFRGRAASAVVVGRVARSVAAEMLEDRRLFSTTFTVINLNADGPGSLWQAVQDANAASGADVIEFRAGLSGAIVTPGTLRVTESLDVRGPGAAVLSVEPANDPEEGRQQGWVIDGAGDNTVRIAGLTLTRGNGQDKNGGAIANSENLVLDRVVVTQNSASGAAGGGVANYGGLTVLSSTISDNYAGGSTDDGGGGIYSEGDLVVRYSTISGNSSGGGAEFGGGVFVAAGTAQIENSTISGNRQAGWGGGLASAGNTTVRDSTIANNKAEAGLGGAPEAGGGVYVIAGETTILSSIVADNQTQQDNTSPFVNGDVAREDAVAQVRASSSVIEVADPAIFAGADGTVFNTDPKLGPLANNGGPTRTHALLPGSVAIDRGYNASNSPTDQRGAGFPRGTANADVGAYEFQGDVLTIDEDDQVFDAYVRDGASANQNFGGGPELLVKKSSSTGSNRHAYLKFDLGDWDAGAPIGSAKIRLVGHLSKGQAGGVPVTLYAVSSTAWAEAGITWNNKPAVGAALGSRTLTSTAATAVEFDVTAYLNQQRAAGKTSVAFALRGTTNTSALAVFESQQTAGAGYPRMILHGREQAAPVTGNALAASHDTYARNGSFAGTTHGSATELLVKTGSSDGAKREAYLKFDVAALGQNPSSAVLRLFGKVSDTRASSLGVTLYGASSNSWNEDTLTWNNKPASGASLGGQTITGTAGRWYEWDVTRYVQDAKSAGKTSVTFVVKANASSSPWVAFNSSEAGSNGPQLVVA